MQVWNGQHTSRQKGEKERRWKRDTKEQKNQKTDRGFLETCYGE